MIRLILSLVMVAFVVRGCGIPYTDGKPVSPAIPLYEDATDATKTTNGVVRTITYTTDAMPQNVYVFYLAQLPPQGWEREDTDGNAVSFGYINGNAAPAFSLYVVAKSQTDGKTRVEMTHTLSGPFGWSDE